MSISTQLQELSNCKTNIKGAIISKGVDMTNVAFTDYPAKIDAIDLSPETVVYNYGTWNSDYPYVTYIPAGSVTFGDSYITMDGGGGVPMIGFTVKDEDINRMVYMLVEHTTYTTTVTAAYRVGMGYQGTAMTSSAPGEEMATARSVPYNSLQMVNPVIIGIPALEKYMRIFVGASQVAKVYKVWLGEKYVPLDVEWTSYSTTLSSPSSGTITDSGFVTSQYVQFTNDGTYKITSVSGVPRVYAHGNNTTVYAYATIEVSNDGSTWTEITKTSQQSWAGTQGTTYTGNTISYSWSDGCPYKYIRVYCKGTSTKRMITATFSGYEAS